MTSYWWGKVIKRAGYHVGLAVKSIYSHTNILLINSLQINIHIKESSWDISRNQYCTETGHNCFCWLLSWKCLTTNMIQIHYKRFFFKMLRFKSSYGIQQLAEYMFKSDDRTVKYIHWKVKLVNMRCKSEVKGGQEWCLCHASKSIYGCTWPWPLTFSIQVVVTH